MVYVLSTLLMSSNIKDEPVEMTLKCIELRVLNNKLFCFYLCKIEEMKNRIK
jgi:hypothetical protein